jgi:hypothetical protein
LHHGTDQVGENTNRAGPRMAPARVSMTAKLVPETKILDELPIGLQIGPLHVLE